MSVQQTSLTKKRLPENSHGFPSNFKRRSRPCALRDFPRNCGPSKPFAVREFPRNCGPSKPFAVREFPRNCGPLKKPNTGIHSPLQSPCMLETDEGSTQGFNNMDNSAEKMAGDDEHNLEAVWELAIENVAGVIAFCRGLVAVLDGECSTSGNITDVAVFSGQQQLMEAENSVEEGVVLAWGQNLDENVSEKGGADVNLISVRGENDTGLMKRDDGILNLDEIVSEKCGGDLNLERVQEKDDTGLGMEWRDLGDDLYVLAPQDLILWQPCFDKGSRDGEGVDVVGSQETEIIVLEEEEEDFNGGKKGKNLLDSGRYEVEKEQDDNLACVEFKDTCNDEPDNYQPPEDLVNLCIVKHHTPEGYKVEEALMKFEELYETLNKQRKERKAELGQGHIGKIYAHIEAAERLKADGMCISLQKPFGHVPGIEIGDTFRFRAQLVVVGLHHQMISGIDYVTIGDEKFATCVVDSGRYDNEAKTNDSLIYTGQGGNPKFVDKTADQKLVKGNLAMVNSMEMGYPIRVIRKRMRMKSHVLCHSKDPKYLFEYDGLYIVTKHWQERDRYGSLVFKFELIRKPDEPRPSRPCPTVAKLGKLLPRKGICVMDDISHGLENHAIRVVNGIDDLRPPPFTYINKIIYPDWCKRVEPIGCNCINGCSDSHQCPCVVKNGGDIPFTEKGSIVRPQPIVYECGPNCKCPPSCMNRVSQHRPRIRLEIFKTRERGWGVRTREYVTSGSFICEYTGELLLEKEAEQRIGHDEYLFDIGDGHDEDGEFECGAGSSNHDAFAIDA
ncbi:uncharacterized protein [Henckelia pumila]